MVLEPDTLADAGSDTETEREPPSPEIGRAHV